MQAVPGPSRAVLWLVPLVPGGNVPYRTATQPHVTMNQSGLILCSDWTG